MDCLITVAILVGLALFNRDRIRQLLWGEPSRPREIEVPWEPADETAADPADRLTRLHDLYERGVLTEEEYKEKKKELLDQF